MKICYIKQPELIIPNNGLLAVSNKSSYWKNGEVLDIYLFEDTKHREQEIAEVYEHWLKNTSLTFRFITKQHESDIRISSVPNAGSWSYVGTNALFINKTKATMNLAWSGKEVTYHEAGHSLGFNHEHQNPTVTIKWDVQKVRQELMRPPNKWSIKQINQNVLNAINKNTVNYTSFDPDSVMLYFFPASWTLDGKGTKENPEPSKTDLKHIQELYPCPTKEKKEFNIYEFVQDFPGIERLTREQLIHIAVKMGHKNFMDLNKKNILDLIEKGLG